MLLGLILLSTEHIFVLAIGADTVLLAIEVKCFCQPAASSTRQAQILVRKTSASRMLYDVAAQQAQKRKGTENPLPQARLRRLPLLMSHP